MATYKGTKITGTSTSAKIFKNSGISKAKAGQTYLNTSTGHTYRCAKGGKASEATWAYTSTQIIKKPSLGVSSLITPQRTTVGAATRYFRTSWGIAKNLTDTKRCDRATGLDVVWTLGYKGSTEKKVVGSSNMSLKSTQVNLNDFTIGNKKYTRDSFYPVTKINLNYISVDVKTKNSIGSKSSGVKTLQFETPRKPSIPNFEFDTSNGQVTIPINTNAGVDRYERYDTRYSIKVTDTRTKRTFTPSGGDSSSQSTAIRYTYDVSDYQHLSYDDYVQITAEAWARGLKGDSEHVSRTYYVSYPAAATIKAVDVSSRDTTGKATVVISTNSTAQHMVDEVKLEYLADTEYEYASQIPGTEVWNSTDIKDDAECTALAMGVTDLIPAVGHYTWVRVKSWHLNENVLYRYSNYVRVKGLETPAPSASTGNVSILSVTPGDDGESLDVQLAWTADNLTGTELSWDESEVAWKSTKPPSTYEFDWDDGQITAGGTTYPHSALINIRDLHEGEKYYIKARRYLDLNGVVTYSNYSSTQTGITGTMPDAVMVMAAGYVPTGSALLVNWTYSGNGLQQQWQIVDDGGTIIANGENSRTSTEIAWDRIAAFAVDGELTYTVQVSVGSEFVMSEPQTVRVIDIPVLSVTAPETVTAQGFAIGMECSTECDVTLIVTSNGVQREEPTGLRNQPAGDTVYSTVYSPEWVQDGDTLTAQFTMPTELDFIENGVYTISAVGVDRATGLSSNEVLRTLKITWAHQAADPSNAVTIEPLDYTDEETLRHYQSARITLTAPEDSAADDVYDIYRYTGDGAVLIGEGFPLTHETLDDYMPFGTDMALAYRVCLRTTDGDIAFADIEYQADGNSLRFDWAGGTLELPYNIAIADGYTKDVDIREHMDGTNDAYWNRNVGRNASFSSDLIRLDQQEDVATARELARYAGPVFVRTPDGSAYEADVQVTDMSTDGSLQSIAIDVQAVNLTQEFMLPIPYPLVEPEGE